MKEGVYLVNRAGKIKTKGAKLLHSNWRWMALQFLAGAIYVSINILYPGHLKFFYPLQWGTIFGLLYWQMRTNPLEGVEIIVRPDFFTGKWSIVFIDGLGMLGYIFKKGVNEEGKISLRVFPFFPSRYTILNRLQLMIIKWGAWAHII